MTDNIMNSKYYMSLIDERDRKLSHQEKLEEILENENHQAFQFCTSLEEKLKKKKQVQKDLETCEKEIERLNKDILKQKDREENEFKTA